MGERIQRPRPVVVSADGATRPYGIDDPVFSRRDVPSEVERVPFGAFEQVLAYPQRPGYRRYWANDTPGRIQRFKSAGYGHVIDDVSGEPVSRITDVANGRGRASYLMETPMRWYQQDMGKQAAALQRRLDDIRNGKAGQDVTVENSYSDIRIERS